MKIICFLERHQKDLVKVENRKALSTCLAGSIKRGQTATEDQQLGNELLQDSKNREEHQYVVDMITDVFNTVL